MRVKTLIAVVLLAIGVGCGAPSTYRRAPNGTAPPPPWVTGKPDTSPVVEFVRPGVHATLGRVKKLDRLIVGAGARVEADSLVEVTDLIAVDSDAVLIAPNLKSCELLGVGNGAKVTAPALQMAGRVLVGMQIKVESPPEDPPWISSGNEAVSIWPMPIDSPAPRKGARVEAQSLANVPGLVSLGNSATVLAPALQSCGEVRLGEGATLEAPCADQAPIGPGESPRSDAAEMAEHAEALKAVHDSEAMQEDPVRPTSSTAPPATPPTTDRGRARLLVTRLKRLEQAGRAMDPLRTGKSEIEKDAKCGEMMRDYQAKFQSISAEANRLPLSYRAHLAVAGTGLDRCLSCTPTALRSCDLAKADIANAEKAIRESR